MTALVLLSLMPLGLGWLLNWYMTIHPETFPPLFIIGAAFLLVWGYISWRVNNKVLCTGPVMLIQNGFAAVALILLAIQSIQGAYWEGLLGVGSQMFYMPMLYFSYCFFDWMGLYGTYFVCFLLMVLVSFLGCRRAEK